MTEYSAFRHLTIGQYLPYGSVVHRLDPRFKILMLCLLMAAVAFATSYTASLILLIALLSIIHMSRVPVGYALQGLRPALPWIAIFAALQLIFYKGQYGPEPCSVVWSWGFISVTTCSLRLIALMVFRLLEFMLLISLLTLTTSTTELTHGLERLLSPLKRLRFPAHELAMVFTIALRFAPTLAGELERIMKAQASRGADFGEQGRLGFIRRTRNLLPLLVPLFLSALRRAEDLTLAMEARGYTGGRGRTSFIQLKALPSDYLALALVCVFCAIILVGNLESIDRQVFTAVSDCVRNVFGFVRR
ncbi:MAG TPA: energy-coupling factor transporter transmembrane component T [Anaerolineae bacterium]|nr:energy-coupling factor transporter transmembrane component T [Anaerolineae bacterium]